MEDFKISNEVGVVLSGKEINDLIITKCKSVIIENCTLHGKFYIDETSIVKMRHCSFHSKDISFLSSDALDVQHCNFYLAGNKPLMISRCTEFGLIHSYLELHKTGLHVLESNDIAIEINTFALKGNIDTCVMVSHTNTITVQSNKFEDNLYSKETVYHFQRCKKVNHGGDVLSSTNSSACQYIRSEDIIVEYLKFNSVDVGCTFTGCSKITLDGLNINKASDTAIIIEESNTGFIRDCTVKAAKNKGILIKDSESMEVRDSTIICTEKKPIPRRPKSNFYNLLGIDEYKSYLEGSGAILIDNSKKINLYDNTIDKTQVGVMLKNSQEIKSDFIKITGSHTGIVILDSKLSEIKNSDIDSIYCGIIIINENNDAKASLNKLYDNIINSQSVGIYCGIETNDNIIIDNDVKSMVSMNKNMYYAKVLLNEQEYRVFLNRLDVNDITSDKETVTTGNFIILRDEDDDSEADVQLRLLHKLVLEKVQYTL